MMSGISQEIEELLDRAYWLRIEGRFDIAISSCQQVLAIDPHHLEAIETIALLYQVQGKYASSIAFWKRSILIEPYKALNYSILSALFCLQGNSTAASRAFFEATNLDPKSDRFDLSQALLLQSEYYFELGNRYASEEKLDLAIKNYEISTHFSPPHYIAPRANLGAIFQLKNANNRAIKVYKNTLYKAGVRNSKIFYNLGLALLHENRFDEAIDCCLEVLVDEPEHPKVYLILRNLMFEKGNKEDAHLCFNRQLPIPLLKDFVKKVPEYTDRLLFDRISVHSQGIPTIRNGKGWFNSHGVFIANNQDQIYPELCDGDIPATLSKLDSLPECSKIDGKIAYLVKKGASNYYHWLFDTVPHIILLKELGIYGSVDGLICDCTDLPFQKDTLSLLGVEIDRIFPIDSYSHVQADVLICPSPRMNYPIRCSFLRNHLLNPCLVEIESSTHKRIYISRKSARYRRIINEEEVISFLNKHGFITVHLEKMSFVEQMALFAGVDIVVSPHGAGLTNTVFCQPETKLIEIFHPDYVIGHYYATISKWVQIKHFYLFGANIETDPSQPSDRRLNPRFSGSDITVNIESLSKLLKFVEDF